MSESPGRLVESSRSSGPGETAADLVASLRQQLDDMPQRLQAAAKFILDRPQDVALMSMREQANAAGVSHSTMMRLAEWLGLGGYAALRQAFARSFRENAGTAMNDQATADSGSDGTASTTIAAALAHLAEEEMRTQLSSAANRLRTAKHILCIGSSREAPVIRHAVHLFKALGADIQALEEVAHSGALLSVRQMKPDSCLFVISLQPHGEYAEQAIRLAVEQGFPSIAIADDAEAVVVRRAAIPIVIPPVPIAPGVPSLTAAMAAIEAISFLWEKHASD